MLVSNPHEKKQKLFQFSGNRALFELYKNHQTERKHLNRAVDLAIHQLWG